MNLKENSRGKAHFSGILQLSSFNFQMFYKSALKQKEFKRAAFEVQGQINQLKVVMKMRAVLPAFHGIFVRHLKLKRLRSN